MRAIHLGKIIFLSLCVSVVAPSTCFGVSQTKDSVKEANKLYQKGKLDEALQKYNEASVAMPDSDIVNFNMGAALYKKENYQKAIDSFTRALTSEDKKLEADALYNLGNCKYKSGKLKENTDLSATVSFLREALDYYKRAVEIDQKNNDARFNHELVERELKVLLDKLKQQESSADKQKSQQEQQKQGTCPTGKEQGKEEKEKEKSGQAQEEQQQDKEKESQGEAQQEKSQKRQEEKQAAKEEFRQEGENKELSEEGARTLLERYGRDEATPDYMDKRIRGYDSEVLKDW